MDETLSDDPTYGNQSRMDVTSLSGTKNHQNNETAASDDVVPTVCVCAVCLFR